MEPVPHLPDDAPIMQAIAIGRRLEEARKAAGYGSQMALARAARLNPMTVHKHEKQGFMPSRSTIELYARLLGVTATYLMYGTDDPMSDIPEVVREYILGPHGESMSPETRRRLAKVPWTVLAGEWLDDIVVHEVRQLIDRNLSRRTRYRDVVPEQLPLLVGMPSPTAFDRPRSSTAQRRQQLVAHGRASRL